MKTSNSKPIRKNWSHVADGPPPRGHGRKPMAGGQTAGAVAKRRRKEVKLIARRARKQAKARRRTWPTPRSAGQSRGETCQSGPRRKKPARQARRHPAKRAARSSASAASKSAKPKRWSRPPTKPVRLSTEGRKSQPQSTEPLDLAAPVALPARPAGTAPGGVRRIHPFTDPSEVRSRDSTVPTNQFNH